MQTLEINSKFKVGDKVSVSRSDNPTTITEVIASFDEDKSSIKYRVSDYLGYFEAHELEHYKEKPKLKVEEYFEVAVGAYTYREHKISREYFFIVNSYFEGRKFSTYEEAYDEAVKYFTESDILRKGARFTIHKRFGVSK